MAIPKFAWLSARESRKKPAKLRVRPRKNSGRSLIPFQRLGLAPIKRPRLPPWPGNSGRLKRASECITRSRRIIRVIIRGRIIARGICASWALSALQSPRLGLLTRKGRIQIRAATRSGFKAASMGASTRFL